MSDDINILLIDSDPALGEAWEASVKQLGPYQCSFADPNVPVEELATMKPDIAVLGPSLDEDACIRCIHILKIVTPFMPILTSCSGVPLAKGHEITPFEGIYPIGPALETTKFSETLKSALKFREEHKMRPDYPVIIGHSEATRSIKQKIQKVAGKDITVLITGETGTGKELIARSLHYHSAQNQGPLETQPAARGERRGRSRASPPPGPCAGRRHRRRASRPFPPIRREAGSRARPPWREVPPQPLANGRCFRGRRRGSGSS